MYEGEGWTVDCECGGHSLPFLLSIYETENNGTAELLEINLEGKFVIV